MTTTKTIFEKIVAGEIPSYKVYEDADTLAFLDINPANHGHTLVVPKMPFANIHEISDEVAAALIHTVKKVADAVKVATKADAIKIIMNNGAAAGQVIFHAHMHVIPRYENDGVRSGVYKKYADGQAEEVAASIRSEIK